MATRSVTDASFDTEVLDSAKPVIVDFWAEWCGPCRMLSPVLEQLAADHGEKVEVVKVNVDESPETSARYGITSIPSVLLFEGGVQRVSVVGARPKEHLEREFAEYLPKAVPIGRLREPARMGAAAVLLRVQSGIPGAVQRAWATDLPRARSLRRNRWNLAPSRITP